MSGTTLIDNIIGNLPVDYNLSALLECATLEAEPRASGGSCDVTFGVIPLAKINFQVLSRFSSAQDENSTIRSGFKQIAIKRARAHALNSLSPEKREKFIKRYAREIKIWSTLEHDNILRLLGYAIENRTFPSLITSWMANGTAKQFLRDKPLEYKVAMTIGVANGLAYLHSRNIIHGDLKADNVLVSEAGRALLADFGISRVLMSDDFASMKTSSNNVVGTLRWMAIEQLDVTDAHAQYSLATDIWSFGMTVYEFLTGNIPFEHIKSEPQVILAILHCRSPHETEHPLFHSEQEVKLWEICQSCWNTNSKNRPSITTLLHHLPSVETRLLTPREPIPRLNQSLRAQNITGRFVSSTEQNVTDMLGDETGTDSNSTVKLVRMNWKEATDSIARIRKEIIIEQDSLKPTVPLNVTDLEIEKIDILLNMFTELTTDLEHILPAIYYHYLDLHSIRSLLSIANIADHQRALLRCDKPICIINFRSLEMLYYQFKYTRGRFLEVAQNQLSQETSPSLGYSETVQIVPKPAMPVYTPSSFQTDAQNLGRRRPINIMELPYELIVTVLMHISAKDIVSFCSTCRFYHDLYGTTSILQYIAELEGSGCQDLEFAEGELGWSHRIEGQRNYLRSKETNWRKCDLYRKVSRLRVDIGSISIYDLTGGIFLMGSSQIGSGLQYIDLREISSQLPETSSSESEGAATMHQIKSRWRHLPVGGDIIDVCLALEEHDLIVVLTTTPEVHGGIVTQKIHLLYLRFSTCEPHPLAKRKATALMQYTPNNGRCSASIEIVGKFLVLLISFPLTGIDFETSACDELYVLDWTTGETLSHSTHEHRTFGGFAFITPSLFVISNISLNALQLVHIFTREDGCQVLCWLHTLLLPELQRGHFISLFCGSSPSPMGTSPDCIIDYIRGRRPGSTSSLQFNDTRYGYGGNGIRSDPLKAIIVFHLTSMHRTGSCGAEFVVHRSRLAELALESLEIHMAPSKKHSPTASESLDGLLRMDTVDGSGRAASSTMGLRPPTASASVNSGRDFALLFDSDTNGDLVHRTSNIKWSEWGPGITRFNRKNEEFANWEVTTAGQRQVLLGKDSQDIIVKDFNIYSVYQQMDAQAHSFALDGVEDNHHCIRAVVSMDEIPKHFVGGIAAYSSLPYVEHIIKPRKRYSAMLIDEERLIGISEDTYPQELDIFTIYP